ncbi:MAG: NAD(P)-dependent oxidoreductase [Gammaproteobacteria bacterium]
MRLSSKDLRSQFFKEVIGSSDQINPQVIVVTHIVEDRVELFQTLGFVADVTLVVAIPYSIDPLTLDHITAQYNTVTPSLSLLNDKDYLLALVEKNIDPEKPFVIFEIGGYFAKTLKELDTLYNDSFLGAVEDTERGHREYSSLDQLPCPVVSAARSSLKQMEDNLIGDSCIYSVEKILRESGYPLHNVSCLVLGYGRIGRGVARALSKKHCRVVVFDINPIKRLEAYSEGFEILEKIDALSSAKIVFGATGNTSLEETDFDALSDEAMLVSCSSKDLEFDLDSLKAAYEKTVVSERVSCYSRENKNIFVVDEGFPVNFYDRAVVGPVLALVQAECLLGIKWLCSSRLLPGIYEISEEQKKRVANLWLDCFCAGAEKSVGLCISENKPLSVREESCYADE